MDFTTESDLLLQDAVVVGMFQDSGFDPIGKSLDILSQGALSTLHKRTILKGEMGETHWLHNLNHIECSVLIIGLGKQTQFNADTYIKVVRIAAKKLLSSPFQSVSFGLSSTPITGEIIDDRLTLWALTQAVIQFNYIAYQFDQFKSEKNPKPILEKISLITDEKTEIASEAIASAIAVSNGIRLARHLVNLPANTCTPYYLVNEALQLEKKFEQIKIQILDYNACETLGMGSFLSVAQGSKESAYFIILSYDGTTKDSAPSVLIGKGITFDTGGISLKPAVDMHHLKKDMGGAASVLGTFFTLGEIKPEINVIGLIPTCENMLDGFSTKPGDVVKSLSGKTIEVLNTDAEGRLILADALTYAERYKPKVVIDIATLTRACVIALGTDVAALYSNNKNLTDDLLESSQRTRDHLWPMPIVESYLELLTKTSCADLANVAPGGNPSAGSIIAACFLQQFATAYPWAHLDIAGVVKESNEGSNATGRPVSVLVDYLLTQKNEYIGLLVEIDRSMPCIGKPYDCKT